MSNIIIIGGGIAGYSAALKLATKENQITLIEKDQIGGNCLNHGCVPTKILLNASQNQKNLALIQKEKKFTTQNLRSSITSLISAKKINYYHSEAKILRNNFILLKQLNKKLNYDRLILAIGSQPIVPKNLQNQGLLSSDEILELNKIPKSLLIIGAGYIGVELSFIFNNLGTKVYLVEKQQSILPLIPKQASGCLLNEMSKKGIKIYTGEEVVKINKSTADLSSGKKIAYDKGVICIGRIGTTIDSEIPFEYEKKVIKTNEFYQTSQKNIWAIGDCINGPMLAHKADYDANILAHNFLYSNKERKNYSNVPSCIFSQPGIGIVGNCDDEPNKVHVDFKNIGKSYCDNSTVGFLELFFDDNKKACGGLVVNDHAQEIIAALIPIINMKLTAKDILKMVWCHPTAAEIIKDAAKKTIR